MAARARVLLPRPPRLGQTRAGARGRLAVPTQGARAQRTPSCKNRAPSQPLTRAHASGYATPCTATPPPTPCLATRAEPQPPPHAGMLQSIGGPRPRRASSSLQREKQREPMKAGFPPAARRALKGEGCEDLMTACLSLETQAPFFCAGVPHSKKTTPDKRSLRTRTTASVNCSQPCCWWEFGLCARTVRQVLSSSTPCFAQCVRQPCGGRVLGAPGGVSAGSCETSVNMFRSDGGSGDTPGFTEKAKPCAWPTSW
mmetsp:Transcript_29481/g.82353  ORF Transcript_29481/g.82353 Transcript_29481/m.82353 type:complete len:256 (-) Transcript_29481:292-1059(-)